MGLLDDILGSFNSGQSGGFVPGSLLTDSPSSGYLPPDQVSTPPAGIFDNPIGVPTPGVPMPRDRPPQADEAGIPSGLRYLLGGQGAGDAQGAGAPGMDDRFAGLGAPAGGLSQSPYLAPGGILSAITGQGAPLPQPRPPEAGPGANELPPAVAAQGGPPITSANALDPYAPQSAAPTSTDLSARGRPPISVPLGPAANAPAAAAPPAAAAQPAPLSIDSLIAQIQERQNRVGPLAQMLGLNADQARTISAGIGSLANVKNSPFKGEAIANGLGNSFQAVDKSEAEHQSQQVKLLDEAIKAKTSGNTDAYRQAMVALRQNQQAQTARQNDVKAMQPVKMGTDAMGREIYGIRDPKTGTLRVIDPKTGQLLAPGQKPQTALTSETSVASGEDAIPGNAQMVSGEGQTRNEEYLKTLKDVDPNMPGIVKKIADYDIDPRTLSAKNGNRDRILGYVAQYDPDYSMPNYPARAAAIKEFTAGGSTSPAAQITAGNTAIQHAGDMSDAAEDMKKVGEGGLLTKARNAGIPFVSYAAAQLQNKSVQGTPEGKALAEFMTAKNHFSEEITKFYAGSGGSEAERKRALDNLDQAKSIEELRSAIGMEAKLMGGKVNALQDRWKNAVGGVGGMQAALRRANMPDYPVIQQKSAEALKKVGARATGEDYQPPGKTSQPGPGAAATPQAGAPAAPKSKADFDALPSGTPFTAPDGSTRIKP